MSIDYAKARETMVEQQVRPWDVLDPRVLETIGSIPREAFVPEALRALAYADTALPLGHGQSMMKPVLEGRALQALQPGSEECVLEIGAGSGYLTACLARLAREVVAIELHADLADAVVEVRHAVVICARGHHRTGLSGIVGGIGVLIESRHGEGIFKGSSGQRPGEDPERPGCTGNQEVATNGDLAAHDAG